MLIVAVNSGQQAGNTPTPTPPPLPTAHVHFSPGASKPKTVSVSCPSARCMNGFSGRRLKLQNVETEGEKKKHVEDKQKEDI